MFKFVIVGTVCALAAAQQLPTWGIEQNIMGTLGTSVSFVNANTGFYPLTDNGEGSLVLKSVDGGKNWNSTGPENVMMFLASDAKGDNIVASSPFGAIYSVDGGKSFAVSDTYAGGQSVVLSNTKAWMPEGNSVQSSSDKGKTWVTHNIPELKTDARYVAAPSDDVIYVSAGEWPQQSNQKDSKSYSLSARWTLSKQAASRNVKALPTLGSLSSLHAQVTDQPTEFKAQIVKSTDGGATWTSQFFADNLGMYFNGIDCYDAKHCCAAAEGTGVAVYCTSDGEKWEQVYSDSQDTLSLMAAAYVGPEEIWIAGGNLDQMDMYAYLLHSTNGGKSWEVKGTDISGQYPNDLSFISPSQGWASTFNAYQESGLMQFKVWSQEEKSFLQ